VSLGTFRTTIIFPAYKLLASFIGFFEILIWLAAAPQVLTNSDQWYLAAAYAGGFSVGNYIGISIEGRFALGSEFIRCMSFNGDVLAGQLPEQGYKVAAFDGGMSKAQPVELLLITEKRRNVSSLIQSIRRLDPSAIYSVSDVKSVYAGPDPLPRRRLLRSALMQIGKHK
jgi:uncharacterized protein YebE (UPF0316 family)